MSNQTKETNGEGQQGVTTTTFAIWILGIVLLGLMAAGYVVLSDRINGQDAWRTTELRAQRNDAKTACEENYKTLQVLQEWVRQQPASKPPPTAMAIKQCPNFDSIENKEH